MTGGLCGIIDGTEAEPLQTEVEKHAKYVTKKNKALATIFFSVELILLYLLGDSKDCMIVLKKLADQF